MKKKPRYDFMCPYILYYLYIINTYLNDMIKNNNISDRIELNMNSFINILSKKNYQLSEKVDKNVENYELYMNYYNKNVELIKYILEKTTLLREIIYVNNIERIKKYVYNNHISLHNYIKNDIVSYNIDNIMLWINNKITTESKNIYNYVFLSNIILNDVSYNRYMRDEFKNFYNNDTYLQKKIETLSNISIKYNKKDQCFKYNKDIFKIMIFINIQMSEIFNFLKFSNNNGYYDMLLFYDVQKFINNNIDIFENIDICVSKIIYLNLILFRYISNLVELIKNKQKNIDWLYIIINILNKIQITLFKKKITNLLNDIKNYTTYYTKNITKCNLTTILKCLIDNNHINNIINHFDKNDEYNFEQKPVVYSKNLSQGSDIEYKLFGRDRILIEFGEKIKDNTFCLFEKLMYDNMINSYNTHNIDRSDTSIVVNMIENNIKTQKRPPSPMASDIYVYTMYEIQIFNDIHKNHSQIKNDMYIYSVFIISYIMNYYATLFNKSLFDSIYENYSSVSKHRISISNKIQNNSNNINNDGKFIDILYDITPLFNNNIYAEENIFERLLFPQIAYINKKKYTIDIMQIICFSIIYNNNDDYYKFYNIHQSYYNQIDYKSIYNTQHNTILYNEIYPFIDIFKEVILYYLDNNKDIQLNSDDNYLLQYTVLILKTIFTKNIKNTNRLHMKNIYDKFIFGKYNLDTLYIYQIGYYLKNNITKHKKYLEDNKIYGCNQSLYVLSLYVLNDIINLYNENNNNFNKLLFDCAIDFFDTEYNQKIQLFEWYALNLEIIFVNKDKLYIMNHIYNNKENKENDENKENNINNMKSSVFIYLQDLKWNFNDSSILLRNKIFDNKSIEIFDTKDKYFSTYFTKSVQFHEVNTYN